MRPSLRLLLLSTKYAANQYAKRHFIFIFIFIFSALFLWLFISNSLDTQRHYGSIINVSGKQRMLTQRIIYLTQNLLSSPTEQQKNQLYVELRKSLMELSEIHKNLKEQIKLFDSACSIYRLYFGSLNLETKLDTFILLGQQILEEKQVSKQHQIGEYIFNLWVGDNVYKVNNDYAYAPLSIPESFLIIEIEDKSIMPIREGILGLLELATFNFQTLAEEQAEKIKTLVMISYIFLALIVLIEFIFLIIPMLIVLLSREM
ncbi:hypothetical protein CCZ01_01990 [Helicobacter monodelphidis]|uniref:type IV pili methyl-accepting chemotaxis transducer N-terminal domain-containing protein n=1 Tax=Helicobacter sp. 15-1451 TaxID=2004995 RepID=UPI000DCD823A|nr:type IV pili methyl-accepting chemotaxis transducer N-terminal domain-containing protein [Helicobacter sp. 15-1451]RAX58578.1 hypothetical protein CCZ01_01990 [Helicobacter sp. 15-1451]